MHVIVKTYHTLRVGMFAQIYEYVCTGAREHSVYWCVRKSLGVCVCMPLYVLDVWMYMNECAYMRVSALGHMRECSCKSWYLKVLVRAEVSERAWIRLD